MTILFSGITRKVVQQAALLDVKNDFYPEIPLTIESRWRLFSPFTAPTAVKAHITAQIVGYGSGISGDYLEVILLDADDPEIDGISIQNISTPLRIFYDIDTQKGSLEAEQEEEFLSYCEPCIELLDTHFV
ncbi:MAG: hypothetical protein Q4B06_01825 [Candidatus Saccharibacteria bacterium]|nr:hypothetical protein [Candidatus Saccharibacteria bacterium]